MPIGIISNSLAIIFGTLIGASISKFIPKSLRENLPTIFGLCAILIAVTLLIEVDSLTNVILYVISGAIIGELCGLGDKVEMLIRKILSSEKNISKDKVNIILTLVMLFCFSGTGIFGALNEGFTGDSSILIAKSVLDFFTAIIFGASVGRVVILITIPQFILNMGLYTLAGFIMPYFDTASIGDFKAVGGILALAAALKLLEVLKINVVNLIPALAVSIIAIMLI